MVGVFSKFFKGLLFFFPIVPKLLFLPIEVLGDFAGNEQGELIGQRDHPREKTGLVDERILLGQEEGQQSDQEKNHHPPLDQAEKSTQNPIRPTEKAELNDFFYQEAQSPEKKKAQSEQKEEGEKIKRYQVVLDITQQKVGHFVVIIKSQKEAGHNPDKGSGLLDDPPKKASNGNQSHDDQDGQVKQVHEQPLPPEFLIFVLERW
jgi:hypothetical protein